MVLLPGRISSPFAGRILAGTATLHHWVRTRDQGPRAGIMQD
ncbi:hypothetical protein CAter282_4165 [Collimonas arenae]|uniref:Uncharacterized protein n=1 Tax=Collimonas arenae TaxID=279058 RepID=A0A127PVY5_9BURK|nr:hypothetical protein CAter10_4534 [Collimonas arenae]AMP11824.1 hypothetical protein CAter282_4165 [Collimonas arenae]